MLMTWENSSSTEEGARILSLESDEGSRNEKRQPDYTLCVGLDQYHSSPAPCKPLFSLDPDNLQLHRFLGLGALFCCLFFCPLHQPFQYSASRGLFSVVFAELTSAREKRLFSSRPYHQLSEYNGKEASAIRVPF